MSDHRWLDLALWPEDQIGGLLDALAGSHGLRAAPNASDLRDHGHAPQADREQEWLHWAASQLGVEALPVTASVRELPQLLASGGPAILYVASSGQAGYLALCGCRRGDPLFLSPALRRIRANRASVEAALSSELESSVRPDVERVLDTAQVSPKRRDRVANAMISERISGELLDRIYLLRLPATASFALQVWQAGIVMRLLWVVILFALIYGANLWGWSLIGTATLTGRVDWGWLVAWVLVLLTVLPWRLLASWNETMFALETGRLVKSRLLAGALALPPDSIKRNGVGQLIGQVMESQALEALALGGGFAVLAGCIELCFAFFLLNQGVSGQLHTLLLCGFLVLTVLLAVGFHHRIGHWTVQRLGMTHYLVEAMVGHRTRLAQERGARRDAQEDAQLVGYLDSSRRMDRASIQLGSLLATAWFVSSLLACAPSFAKGQANLPMTLAISLGGIMLGQGALGSIAGGLASVSRAGFAWSRIREIFRAGSGGDPVKPPMTLGKGKQSGSPVLEARNLLYRYGGNGPMVINGASISISRGDRILVEGPSGGGKSTLAGLLTGLREPESGLMLLDGLDRPTLGDEWHGRVAAAPQFHENHILSGSLAFNLLMGRQWPARDADIAEAEQLCEELGLGELLQRMPGGIHQRVGETGWQLSHGERSRIFLARALLQNADVTILDESFGSLDPATMSKCLNTALAKAETLLVIAHP